MDTLLWYWAISWDYVAQMLPCMLLAALVFFLLRPWRKKRLARQGMASGGLREAALLFFVMFCAGLAALTVFPAYFWTAYHWQEALAGHEVFFPLTPLSESIQEIQWTPYGPSKSAGRRLGADTWPSPICLSFARSAFFRLCCGGGIAVCGAFSPAFVRPSAWSSYSCLWGGPLTSMI